MRTRVCILMLILLTLASAAIAENIVATDFPCYDLTRAVLGSDESLTLLIRPGMEVHSFDPTPSDILKVQNADLFVYIGGESDEWADTLLSDTNVNTLRLIDQVNALEEEGSDEPEPEFDEHIWTSPKNAIRMLDAVEEALIALMPDRADTFRANADTYRAELIRQDEALTALIANADKKTIVVADRFPFLYLAKDYSLHYASAFPSCSAESEPSAKVMVELIDTIQRERLSAVYTIELSNRAIARTIAEETGCDILELNSIQTVTQKQFDAGETYVSLMDANLRALEEGLN